MKTSRMLFVCFCLVGLTQLVWGQRENRGEQAHGIPGYLDPETRTFTTKAQTAEATESAAVTENYGTYNIDINASLITPVPSGAIVDCTAALTVIGDANGSYTESVSAPATKSGTIWKCDMTVYYAWFLSSPTTDTITITYTLAIEGTYTVGGSGGTSAPKIYPIRSSTYAAPLVTGVPTPGATTTKTYTAEL